MTAAWHAGKAPLPYRWGVSMADCQRLPHRGGAGHDVLTALGGAFEDRLEGVELGDLGPHLPGDHRRHELHEPGRLQIKGEPNPRAVAGRLGELECAGRAGRARGDQEFEPARPLEDRDLVVAVDAP